MVKSLNTLGPRLSHSIKSLKTLRNHIQPFVISPRPQQRGLECRRPYELSSREYATVTEEQRDGRAAWQEQQSISLEQLDRERNGRERIVVLGSGWAGYNLGHSLDQSKFQTIIVSPRSYFVFTPLLASTATGTLEFRTAVEPVRRRRNSPTFFQAWADDVDFFNKTVTLEEAVTDPRQGLAPIGSRFEGKSQKEVESYMEMRKQQRRLFDLKYDKLIVSVGAYSQTFNTPGVKEHAHFLKDVGDARRIRQNVLSCYESAALPTTPEPIRRQLLNFAIVGGGPTGIEFAAELHDLIRDDLSKLYPHLKGLARLTVHDVAPTVLNMFDKKLSDYAIKTFGREGIDVKTQSVVESLKPHRPKPASLSEVNDEFFEEAQSGYPGLTMKIKGQEPKGVGMVVWSTGLMPNPFIAKSLSHVHKFPEQSTIFKGDEATARESQWAIARDSKTGSIVTNDRMRVILEAQPSDESKQGDEFAKKPRAYMTDVYALGDCAIIDGMVYPATAQVANQKATWLAKRLNKGDVAQNRFRYKDLGVMAYVGGWRAIFQGGGKDNHANISGRAAWVIWRGAYLVKSVSWRNKVLIPVYWVINWIFGRDISRF